MENLPNSRCFLLFSAFERDVRLIVTDAVRHILEASLGDKGQPPRRLALPLAELPQRLEV